MTTRIAVALPIEQEATHIVILMADDDGHSSDRIVMIDAGYARAFASDLLRAAEESERRLKASKSTFSVVTGGSLYEGREV